MKGIAILGSTGSIGQSALAVVDTHPDKLRVVALAAGGNADRLAEQVSKYTPSIAALAAERGPECLIEIATHPDADVVLFASSGTAALDAVLAAIDAGKTIALANKEILVMAGSVVMAAARRKGVAVLPVDSEHNAIHQCLHARTPSDVTKLILTASGGPFRNMKAEALAHVTAEDALRHPTWRMGPKITIDSATLMNKGLEVIEARWLFDVGADRIEVLVHPQSIVHSMVEFVDGSVIAQLGVTDMRLPIQYAFSYPERWGAPVPPLDLARAGKLEFEAPDTFRFPCLGLAFRALRGAEGLSIVLNAANEIAVSAFMDGQLGFQGIPGVITQAMDAYERQGGGHVAGLDDVRAIDGWARAFAARAANGGTIDPLTILAFLFVLGVLIFVHELGHFLMARRIGVKVLTFSLGFGPKLLNVKRGDTEYCISAIPLGGYVKMAGENPEDSLTGAPDEYLSKGKWQRFQVLIMGPVMNLILAVVVMAVVFYQGAQVPIYEQLPVTIGSFSPTSVAKLAGVQVGDRIVTIDGKPIDTWDECSMAILPKAKRSVELGIVRGGKPLQVTVVPLALGKYELADIGVLPMVHPEFAELNPGEPAAQTGFRKGDIVLAAGGEQDITYEHLIAAIRRSENTPLPFTIKRGDTVQTLTVTPRKIRDTVMIGAHILPFETRTVDPGPWQAVKLSANKNWEWASQIVETLVGLFTRETSVKQLMGPVAIMDLSGTAARMGWIELFTLMAMISLNLGLLNLMPIPVLDGGHIFILALEGLARRDFSMKIKEKMLLAGFVLLLMLMVTVIYNDLMRIQWIGKLVPWR